MKQLIYVTGLLITILFAGAFVLPLKSGDDQFKENFLNRINQIRQEGCKCGTDYMAPAPPLSWNNNLAKAAFGHAKDMANHDYFSHTSKDGRSMEDRIVFAGYTFKGFRSFAIGENIAAGQQQIDEVMDGWIKSPGHCKNLMNPQFKEVGVSEYNHYWVQDFGGRESFSTQEQKMIKAGKYKVIEEKGH